MNKAKAYRAKAATLLATAQEPRNDFLRSEYEYLASVYLRLAEQAVEDNSEDKIAMGHFGRPWPPG
jgi:hypothetical protein